MSRTVDLCRLTGPSAEGRAAYLLVVHADPARRATMYVMERGTWDPLPGRWNRVDWSRVPPGRWWPGWPPVERV